MTGICGFISFDTERDAAMACTRMRQALAMFGPHGGEQWNDGGISLGIQKYRTLPEDIYDRQPLSDDRFCMVADLRLDNRPELAAEFGWAKEDAARRADADYAFAAWQKWGEACFDKLIGDWALAIWDRQENRLTLARDFIGSAPLFWHQGKTADGTSFFAFSSMTHGLFALPQIKMAPNPELLKFHLALAPMRGDSWFFRDIHRVLPGGVTHLSADGKVDSHAWYDWSRMKEVPVRDDAACIRKFRELFDRAVKDQLRTTGGIACHLSSGFDSSAVATTAARLLAKTGKRISAYTHVPHQGWQQFVDKGRLSDEGAVAKETAATCPNIDHYLVDSGDREFGSDLAATFYYAQAPMSNLCNQVWGHEILRHAARDGARILLTGQMGNMTISQQGLEKQYDDFWHGHLLTWWRDMWALKARGYALKGTLYRTFAWLMPAWLVNLLRQLTGRIVMRLQMYSALNPRIAKDPAFLKQVRARNYDPVFRPHWAIRDMAEFVVRRMDMRGVHHQAMLAQTGIDIRDPTRDRRLMEFSLSLPPRMWLLDGQQKWLYCQAFGGQVPESVTKNLRHKGQQGADWPERMRRSWSTLKMELEPALEDPMVQDLLDTDLYRDMLSKPFPDKIRAETMDRYRLKFLRGLAIAHFIRKANMRN